MYYKNVISWGQAYMSHKLSQLTRPHIHKLSERVCIQLQINNNMNKLISRVDELMFSPQVAKDLKPMGQVET